MWWSGTTKSLISLIATLCLLITIQLTPTTTANHELLHHHYNILSIMMIPSSSSSSSTPPNSTDTRTAYQILEEYTFPIGLLPKGVTGYDLNSSTGKFSVHFNDTSSSSCTFSLQNSRQFMFKSTIKGYISNGKINSLEGVYVRLFMVYWMEIVEILWSGDDLVFTAGVVSAAFPADNFRESPHCGCGFTCGAN